MAINSRKKGAKNERVVADLFTKWTGRKFAKTPASGGLQWQSSFSKGDIVSTDEKFYFPFCIEAKFYEKIDFSHLLTPNIKNVDILKFWEQCNRDAEKCNKIPMLLMRYNGLPKDFYFTVINTQFFEFCIEPFWYKRQRALIYEDLSIIPSDWLFNIPYKKVRGIFNNYQNNLKEKIKKWDKNPTYKISNRGYFIDGHGSKLYGCPDSHGAMQIFVQVNNKSKRIRIYREVAKVFVKNPKQKPMVNHVKPNRNISDARNLQWVTASENGYHRWENSGELGYRVLKIDKITNKVLGEYISCYSAARSINYHNGKHISRVLRGIRKTAHGFKWLKKI